MPTPEAVVPSITNGKYELVPLARLKRHPRNTNQGQVGAIEGSLAENGFFGALLVQESTGFILVGNHTFEAAKKQGLKEVPVIWMPVDEQRALKIMLADNRTARLAHEDEKALAKLLGELKTTSPTGLEGTGYTNEALSELERLLRRPNRAAVTPAEKLEHHYLTTHLREIKLVFPEPVMKRILMRVVRIIESAPESAELETNTDVFLFALDAAEKRLGLDPLPDEPERLGVESENQEAGTGTEATGS